LEENQSDMIEARRVLLLVPRVTYRAADFLAAASRLGIEVVIGSDGALPLGVRPVIPVDPYDLPGSIDRIVRSGGPLDAVVAVDTPMLAVAAAVGERIGLPHNPMEAVMATMDKRAQRCRWAATGVPQPAFRVIAAGSDEYAVMSVAAELKFPCVVKALSLSGSQGILRVDHATDVPVAARRIRRVLSEGRGTDIEPLLIEEYVPGLEISIDALLTDGVATVIAVFDKPEMPDGPTFEETMLICPARLSDETLAASVSVAERATRALGLRHGPIHAELRIDPRHGDERPTMLELAARSIGGLCSRALRFAGNTSLEEMVLLNALGVGVTPQQETGTAGIFMLPLERAGVLHAIEGQTEAADVPGITGLSISIPLGETVHPLPEGDRYLGFVFGSGGTPEDVEAALRAARLRLRVVIR